MAPCTVICKQLLSVMVVRSSGDTDVIYNNYVIYNKNNINNMRNLVSHVERGAQVKGVREEQAMSWHWFSPSPFLSSSPQPQLSPVRYTDTHPTHNVVCPSGV